MSMSTVASTEVYRERPPALQSLCSCPSTPCPRLIRSRVSVGDLQRAPARCSIRPLHRPYTQCYVSSHAHASHGLFVTSPCVPPAGKPPRHAVRGFRSRRRPSELPYAPGPGCTAQPRAHGSKFQLNPSSWARVVPIPRFGLASPKGPRGVPPTLQSQCSCPSTPSPRLIRSRVSLMDLQRAPPRCSIRPLHRSKMQVAACSCGDASHGLFVTSSRAARAQAAPARGTRFQEYNTAIRARVCTWSGLYGSATSAWVKVSAQSELMGPDSADSARFGLASALRRVHTGSAAHIAITVLMPFHSITTADSVESINKGLAKSPSEMPNPSTSLPKGAGGRV